MNETKTDNLAQAVAALGRGDVIVFPTETLYGLGADALNSSAVQKVFRLKGRDARNPFPVLVSGMPMLESLVVEVPPLAKNLIERFWPGPLTLVLPARAGIPRPLINRTGGIGVRISSQPIARRLVDLLGKPLTATSANPSGQPGARTLAQTRSYFSPAIEIFIDGGQLASSAPSTVVEVAKEKLVMIRQGAIDMAELQCVVGSEVFVK